MLDGLGGGKPVEGLMSEGELSCTDAAQHGDGVLLSGPSEGRGGTVDGGQVLVEGL